MTSIQAPGAWSGTRPLAAPGRSRAVEISVLAFFFIFYTNLAVIAVHFHGVPQIVASTFALLLLVPLARHVVLERQPLVVTPVLPLFLAFLAALFLSAAISSEPEVAREAVVPYLSEGLILYLLVSNAVRSTPVLNRVVWVLIFAGSMLGALSLTQELTHAYANDFGGLAQVDRFGAGGGFNIAPEDAEEKILRPRLGGPLGSENRYAQILAAVLPLALIRAFRDRTRRLRLAAAGGSLLISGGILLSFSRGAAVAVAATLALMVLMRELPIRRLLALLAVLTAIVAFAVPEYVTRLTSLEGVTALSSGDAAERPDAAIVGRSTENLAAWNTFLDHPIAGVGPGVYFKEYSREYANRLGLRYLQSDRRGHSLYLELAADTGLIGLGAFVAMVGTAMVLLYRSARYWRERDPQRAMLASSFCFSLVAYLACAAFLHLSYQRYFWGLLALASAVIWSLRRESEEEDVVARAGAKT